MESFANAMPAIFPHHGEVVRFHIFLNRAAQLAQTDAGLNQTQGKIEALLGDAAQALALDRRFADDKHLRGIAVILIFDDGDIDIDDIAIF